MTTLHLVATPIGNLEDVTLRALRILREVPLIAAEDTRTARKLLTHYDIHTKLVSYNEHNMRDRTPQLLQALETGDLALVSEAGTPGLSDPGHELVVAAIAAGHAVSPVPGPAAPIAALVASGLPFRQFAFLGFLPRRSTERKRLFTDRVADTATLVCFESPHRLRDSLHDILSALGDRSVGVCRELTKLHEESVRGRASTMTERFREGRGEFTVVVRSPAAAEADVDEAEVRDYMAGMQRAGARRSGFLR